MDRVQVLGLEVLGELGWIYFFPGNMNPALMAPKAERSHEPWCGLTWWQSGTDCIVYSQASFFL